MARIKYIGPVDPMSIPGLGPVGTEWKTCGDALAAQFEGEPGFEVERDPAPKKKGGPDK